MKTKKFKLKTLINRLMKSKEQEGASAAGERPVKETCPDGAVCRKK